MTTSTRLILIILSLCLAAGGATHVLDIVNGGWLPYKSVPLALNAFWTSLALLDFVAVLLLWASRKAGIALTTAIMLADVAINSYATYGLGLGVSFLPLQAQTLFLGFVLGSLALVWPDSEQRARPLFSKY